MTIVILAAGIGSRYGGLKQLEAVGPGGATIMDYSVFDARRAGCDTVVFVIRPQMQEAFDASIGSRYRGHLCVEYAHQHLEALPVGFAVPAGRTKPWGTGQALLVAERLVDGPFVAANADDFYGPTAFAALGDFLRQAPTATPPTFALVGYTLRDTLSESGAVSRGVCRSTPDGWLESITETLGLQRDGRGVRYVDARGQAHRLTGDEPVSMNLWAFHPPMFALLREGFETFLRDHGTSTTAEFYLPQVVQDAMQRGHARVRVLPTQERWCGVTHPQDKARVTQIVRGLIDRGVYPEKLWN